MQMRTLLKTERMCMALYSTGHRKLVWKLSFLLNNHFKHTEHALLKKKGVANSVQRMIRAAGTKVAYRSMSHRSERVNKITVLFLVQGSLLCKTPNLKFLHSYTAKITFLLNFFLESQLIQYISRAP